MVKVNANAGSRESEDWQDDRCCDNARIEAACWLLRNAAPAIVSSFSAAVVLAFTC